MKKQIAAVTLLALLVFTVAGCVTAKGPSDEEMVKSAANTFIQGLISKNPDAALTVVSPEFYHADAGDKAGLRNFIADAIDSGYLDDAEADTSSVEYTIDAEKGAAKVYPVVINSAAGSATMGINLTKKDGAWAITGLDIEGV